MAYEVFVRKMRRIGTPAVAFQQSGRMSLNAAATKILKDQAAEMVVLLWDPMTRKVAIRPVFKKDERSYKLNKSGKGNGSGFSAVTFFEHIGFDHTKETKSFTAEWNNDQQMFEISLEQADVTEAKPLLALGAGKRHGR
jgi:hypothetical protein